MTRNRIDPVTTRSAGSDDPDPVAAAAALIAALGTEAPLYALFVTAGYPRAELAAALYPVWGDRLIGCTSAGNIGPGGFISAPVLAVAFTGGELVATTVTVEPLSDLPRALDRVRPELARAIRSEPGVESFGLLLVDGLSMMEEHLASALKSVLEYIPLIGGSAGEDFSFTETAVLAGGEFRPDRATLTMISTRTPFRVFRMQHYEPQEAMLVITAATPALRQVQEINGLPAAQAYSEAIGVPVAGLGTDTFIANPVLLRAGGENWVRGITSVLPGGGLQFAAAIDTGAVLRLGRPGDVEGLLRARLAALPGELGGAISGMLTCDCVGRRVELTLAGQDEVVGRVLSEYQAVGFSTYGEQFDDFHMNQTMVGVAFGGLPTHAESP
jgi:hypothetical protein